MPRDINRQEVQRLVREGAQLVEVLPHAEYEEEHLPGAISLPLRDLNRQSAEHLLSHDRPLIVYCWDFP